MRHRLTGSRVALADAGCLYWARPDVEVPALTSDAAALGSAAHETFERVASGNGDLREEDYEGPLRALTYEESATIDDVAERWGLTPSAAEQLRELHGAWRGWWRDFVPEGAMVRHEVPFAWNVETWTARELPQPPEEIKSPSARRAWLDERTGPNEVRATIDAVIIDDRPCSFCHGDEANTGDRCACLGVRRRLTIVDFKTGRRQHQPARDHAQLATGALCAARVLGISEVRVVLARVYPEAVWTDEAVLDDVALDGRALTLADHLRALPTAEPVPGPHCAEWYCPLLGRCEGPRALARRAPELARALSVRIETEEQAAAALAAVKPLEAFIAELKRETVRWAEQHGGAIQMPDGATYKRVPQVRRSVDLSRAEGALRRRFGADFESLVKTRKSVSISDVERAAAGLGPQGRKRDAVEARRLLVADVLREVESTGGLKVSSFDQWEVEGAPALPGARED